MEPRGFVLLMSLFSLGGSILAFIFKDGGFLPVRTWPFATREQSVRFTAWAMLAAAIVLAIIWLTM